MQNFIAKPDDLLTKDGSLKQIGWAKRPILNYNRQNIKASRLRIKEWDYYCILNNDYGLALTIADLGYMGLISATVLDFIIPLETTKSVLIPFPMGNLNLPTTSKSGNIFFNNKRVKLSFIREQEKRILEFSYKNFQDKADLKGKIILTQPSSHESIVITIPFPENKHAFYYNQKINSMPAEGSVRLGDKEIIFDPENSFAVLDWGRGVWPYKNTWYWGSASGKISGKLFGFNIGYGFGDNSQASENALFYDGKIHKLDHIRFHIPRDNYLNPWKFTSNDSRFEMDFEPIIDRNSNMNFILLRSIQHQVFGRFSGKAILDDGQVIEVKDLLGFAEKVINYW